LTGITTTGLNKLVLHGCDSSGDLLQPDNGWVSAQGEFDYSAFPNLEAQSNFTLLNTAALIRCLKISSIAQTTTALVTGLRESNFCVFDMSGAGAISANALIISSCFNSIIRSNLNSFAVLVQTTAGSRTINTRVEVISNGTTSGILSGIGATTSNANNTVIGNTVLGVAGDGIRFGAGYTTAPNMVIANNTIVDCGGTGIDAEHSAAPAGGTATYRISSNMITGCSLWGIASTFDFPTAVFNRIRDCSSGVISGLEIQYDNIVSAGTDADEYVNSAAGDYRIKFGSAIWGLGIGAGDEPASGGGGGFRAVNIRGGADQ
jgi:hypothetical protein